MANRLRGKDKVLHSDGREEAARRKITKFLTVNIPRINKVTNSQLTIGTLNVNLPTMLCEIII